MDTNKRSKENSRIEDWLNTIDTVHHLMKAITRMKYFLHAIQNRFQRAVTR